MYLLLLYFRDLWYFLYSSTDRSFRQKYLNEVLKIYHEHLSKYLQQENFSYSFEDFMKEMNHFKVPTVFLLAMPILFIMLNPEPERDTISKARRAQDAFIRNMEAEPKAEDHPQWVELRKRYTEIIEELNEDNFL